MLKTERLIVYPLLFLSLISSLVGIGAMQASQNALERLAVRELVVVNEYGQEVVYLGATNLGGSLSIFTNEGEKVAWLQTVDDIFVVTELGLRTALDHERGGISITAFGGPGETHPWGQTSQEEPKASYNISFKDHLVSYVSLDHTPNSSNGTTLTLESHSNTEGIQNIVSLGADETGSHLWFHSEGDLDHYREKPRKMHLSLWGSRAEGGSLGLKNGHGDDRASLFQSVSGHGGLWVYDKYGEDSTGYIFRD